jgi:drug/metabolite transporter (DMT)-like permease
MFYLLVTIFLNVIIAVLFKLFPRYGVNTPQAIVVNYLVCVVTGCLYIGEVPFDKETMAAPWVPWALVLGGAFISIFNLIAYNIKIHGITTATIANKLSLVIPVVFSFFLYREHIGLSKIAGVLLALPAVYLTSWQKQEKGQKMPGLFWPLVLFVSSGLLDTSLKYVECNFLSTGKSQAVFSIYTFAVAATLGVVMTTVLAVAGKVKFEAKNIIAGILVGVPNYFSIYFLIAALNCGILQSSAAIPTINISILVLSTLVALLFFKEQANGKRITGLILSIIAILLIALGD